MKVSFGLGKFTTAEHIEAQQGDLIEIDRIIYALWALYVGNGEIVIVRGRTSEISGNSAVVRKLKLVDVSHGCVVRVNNKHVPAKERRLKPLRRGRAVKNALDHVGKTVPFNLLTRNSEHYVTEWKFGLGWSDQANVALSVMRKSKKPLVDPSHAHQTLANSITEMLDTDRSDTSLNQSTEWGPAEGCE